jgi:hypothetical protein
VHVSIESALEVSVFTQTKFSGVEADPAKLFGSEQSRPSIVVGETKRPTSGLLVRNVALNSIKRHRNLIWIRIM